MRADDGAAAHVGDWLRREPGMELARYFCPEPMRARFGYWGALLDALCRSAFEPGEPHIAQARLSWWQEQFTHGEAHASTHPLWRALRQECAAARREPSWPALAAAALAMLARSAVATDTSALLESHLGLATVAANLEADLFDARPAPASVARHLVLRRLRFDLANGRSHLPIPLHLSARHARVAPADLRDPASRALVADLGRELSAEPADLAGAAGFRRMRDALDRIELDALASGRIESAGPTPRTLWRVWRAARGA